jgi:hypothetical protein
MCQFLSPKLTLYARRHAAGGWGLAARSYGNAAASSQRVRGRGTLYPDRRRSATRGEKRGIYVEAGLLRRPGAGSLAKAWQHKAAQQKQSRAAKAKQSSSRAAQTKQHIRSAGRGAQGADCGVWERCARGLRLTAGMQMTGVARDDVCMQMTGVARDDVCWFKG